MKYLLTMVVVALLSGCATWGGVKQDAKDGAEWTKEKVNEGATYVKEKTEQLAIEGFLMPSVFRCRRSLEFF